MDVAASIIAIVELTVSISFTCIQYARGVSRAAEEAAALQKELGSLVQVLSRLQHPSVSSDLKMELEPDFKTCREDLLGLQVKLKPAEGFEKLRQSLVWPFRQQGEFRKIKTRIEKHFALFHKAMAVSTLEITDDIRNQLAKLRLSREADRDLMIERFDEIGKGVAEIKKDAKNENDEKAMKWLKVVDYELNFSDNIALLNPNTGTWFFEEGQYFPQWLQRGEHSQNNILVLGQAGAGKTVLMSAAVKTALTFSFPPPSKVCVAYYYFDFRNSQRTRTSSMLCSLIHQLISHTSTLPDGIAELRSMYSTPDLVPISKLVRIFAQQCSQFDTTLLIIDALDECENFDQVGNILIDISKNAGTSADVRTLCFSRDEVGIKRCLEPLKFSVRPLETRSVGQDIATYVRDALRDDKSGRFKVFHRCAESLREKVISTLEQKSEGMFRWAQCQVDEISRCRTGREIKDALDNLPSTLEKTYERIFKRMSPFDLERAKRIFSWLIGADGPMTSGMLIEALTINYDKLEVDDEDRLQDHDDIRDICRSLVRESGHQNETLWPNCKIISLAHFTVEQYLLSPQAGEFRLDWRNMHVQLAKSCLAFSTSPVWERLRACYSQDDFEPKSSGDLAQFLDYTCGDIFSHLQFQGVEHEAVKDIIAILQQDGKLKNLRQNCYLIYYWCKEYQTPFQTGLHLNIRSWQPGGVRTELLNELPHPDHTSNFLSKAVVAGLYETTFFLIEHAIDFDATDIDHQTPMAFLVAMGGVDQTRRFIVKNKERYQRAAATNLRDAESILKSIVGTTVNGLFTAIFAKSGNNFYALLNEVFTCLDLLQDRSYNKQTFRTMMRLSVILSAVNGNKEFLICLRHHISMSNKFDAREIDQIAREALYASIHGDHVECVRELLDSGVSPTARAILPTTPKLLYPRYDSEISLEDANKEWASYLNPELLLDQLEDHFQERAYSDEGPETALKAAMPKPGLARLLLGNDTDVLLDNVDVWPEAVELWLLPPSAKGFSEDHETLQALVFESLERSSNREKLDVALINCSGHPKRTAIVQQLLAKGADLNSSLLREKYGDFKTPLFAACEASSLETVKVLLEAGADPNLEDGFGRLPSIAAFGRYAHQETSVSQQIFKLLQEKDPSLRTRAARALLDPPPMFHEFGYDSRAGSVLSAVIIRSIGRSEQLPVEFLESSGLLDDLDTYLAGDDYGTPLIAASATNQAEFVDLLMNHGATVDGRGHPGTEWSLPALAAIYGRHFELALRLLRQQKETSMTVLIMNEEWSKALMFTLGYKHFPDSRAVALKLIEFGANVNFVMDERVSDFMDFSEDRDSIRHYLTNWGTTMIAACAGGDVSLIEKLLEAKASEQVSRASSYGDALTAACSSEEVKAVQVFLQRGDDVNKFSKGRDIWCPLVAVAQVRYSKSSTEIVRLLLKEGARADKSYPFENPSAQPNDLEILTHDLKKSLHFALMWKKMWEDCTITGPSMLQGRPFFGSAFIAATVGRDEDVMKLIAEQECVDVNQEVSCGIYPTAMMATLDMKKMYNTTGPLRELGATEITASQMLNFSHPFRAILSEVVKENALLKVPGSFWGNMITLCVNVEIAIPYLLQQGADPNEAVLGSFYGSAFIAASALLRPDAMIYFLEYGCDVNVVVPDSAFGTSLIAVCSGPAHYPFKLSFHEEYDLNDPPNWSMVQFDLLEILLDKGADPNVTHRHFSPLIALVLCDCEKHYKMESLKILLDRGANVNVTLPQWGYDEPSPEKRWSAIGIAERRGDAEVTELLKQYARDLPPDGAS